MGSGEELKEQTGKGLISGSGRKLVQGKLLGVYKEDPN